MSIEKIVGVIACPAPKGRLEKYGPSVVEHGGRVVTTNYAGKHKQFGRVCYVKRVRAADKARVPGASDALPHTVQWFVVEPRSRVQQ